MVKQRVKYIQKNPRKTKLLQVIDDIMNNTLEKYDLKKLEGYPEYWRVRVGDMRIVFQKKGEKNVLIAVDTRGDIYKHLS